MIFSSFCLFLVELLQFATKKEHLQKVLDLVSTSRYSNIEIEVNRVLAAKQLEKGYKKAIFYFCH